MMEVKEVIDLCRRINGPTAVRRTVPKTRMTDCGINRNMRALLSLVRQACHRTQTQGQYYATVPE